MFRLVDKFGFVWTNAKNHIFCGVNVFNETGEPVIHCLMSLVAQVSQVGLPVGLSRAALSVRLGSQRGSATLPSDLPQPPEGKTCAASEQQFLKRVG